MTEETPHTANSTLELGQKTKQLALLNHAKHKIEQGQATVFIVTMDNVGNYWSGAEGSCLNNEIAMVMLMGILSQAAKRLDDAMLSRKAQEAMMMAQQQRPSILRS